ncbi:hypothetical protein PFISCL1PPCAC_23188, partial [Pristionchus fissidentatus]
QLSEMSANTRNDRSSSSTHVHWSQHHQANKTGYRRSILALFFLSRFQLFHFLRYKLRSSSSSTFLSIGKQR